MSHSSRLDVRLGQTGVSSTDPNRSGLPGPAPSTVIWELHHLLVLHSSDNRQLHHPCPAGLFPPPREEEGALPANSPASQTSFHSSLPSAPEKETSESGNFPGVCSGQAPCSCRSARGSALRRASTRGEGKDHRSSACTRPALSGVNLKMRLETLGPETISAPSLRVGSGEISLSYVFLPQTQRSLGEL